MIKIKIEEVFYTCRWDKPFKEIFLKEENRDLLTKLLEMSLHVKIYDIKELNVEKRVRNIYVKGKRVDILLDTNIGRIGIELNAGYYDYLHVRNLAYQCDTYAHYTLKGEEYSEEVKIIQINFTYGLESKQETKKLKLNIEERYWVQTDRNLKYVSNFLIIEFNMDKIMSFWYAKNEEKIKEYKYFIMMDLNRKELEKLARKDRMVGKYMEDIERLNESPEFHIYMTEEEDKRKIHNTEMRIAREKGLSQGAKQNSISVAHTLLSLGIEKEKISIATGLSLKELEKLKKKKTKQED